MSMIKQYHRSKKITATEFIDRDVPTDNAADSFDRRTTVKPRCNEHRYSDYLGVTIPLACTDLVHTNFNDYFAIAIIVAILSFPLV